MVRTKGGKGGASTGADHPDKEFREYILRRINEGFRIGSNYKMNRCRPAASNVHSATEHSQIVQQYLDNELALGHIVGPVDPAQAPKGTQTSPFGVIPKSGQPGRWLC